MIKERLEQMRKSEGFMNSYTMALSNLYQSGVLDVLRELGKVRTIAPSTPNFVDAQAAVANMSIGYNACLDDLTDFIDAYVYPKGRPGSTTSSDIQPDFEAIATLLKNGDITAEEAQTLRKTK